MATFWIEIEGKTEIGDFPTLGEAQRAVLDRAAPLRREASIAVHTQLGVEYRWDDAAARWRRQ